MSHKGNTILEIKIVKRFFFFFFFFEGGGIIHFFFLGGGEQGVPDFKSVNS